MRPRQIDITKPLPVVWLKTDEVDQQAQALEGLYKSLTVSKRSTEQVKQKNQELVISQTRVPLKVCIGEVPIPHCRLVEDTEDPDPPFDRGLSYIHYTEAPYDFDVVEYELDDQDADFLEDWNEKCVRQDRHAEQITEADLEAMINTFDNQAYIHRDKHGIRHLTDSTADALAGVTGSDDGSTLVLTEEAIEKLKEFAKLEGVDEALLEYLSKPDEEEAVCSICRQAQRVKARLPDGKKAAMDSAGGAGGSGGSGGRGRGEAQEAEGPPMRTTRQQDSKYMVEDLMTGEAGGYKNPEKLLYCEMCGKYAHVRCCQPSWLPASDEDGWLCDYCYDISNDLAANRSKKCELCPFTEGMLKRVQGSSKRAHITCALFLPETSVHPSGIAGINDVHPGRWDMICRICHEAGACVQCKARYCRAAYHPMCAHDEEFFMNCKTGTVFCPKHSAERRAREKAGAGSSGRAAGSSKRKKVDTQLLLITNIVKEQSVAKLGKIPASAINAAFGYWFRRRQKQGAPLVPRLEVLQQEKKELEASKPRRGKKVQLEDQEWLDRLLLLRHDLEKGRILLDIMRRREATKREWLEAARDIFNVYIQQEERHWEAPDTPKRGRGRPRTKPLADGSAPPQLSPAGPVPCEAREHLWQYVPRALPRAQVASMFPSAPSRRKTARPRKQAEPPANPYERQISGSTSTSRRTPLPKRPAGSRASARLNGGTKPKTTGRPVGRPRKYPPPKSPVPYPRANTSTGRPVGRPRKTPLPSAFSPAVSAPVSASPVSVPATVQSVSTTAVHHSPITYPLARPATTMPTAPMAVSYPPVTSSIVSSFPHVPAFARGMSLATTPLAVAQRIGAGVFGHMAASVVPAAIPPVVAPAPVEEPEAGGEANGSSLGKRKSPRLSSGPMPLAKKRKV